MIHVCEREKDDYSACYSNQRVGDSFVDFSWLLVHAYRI